MSEVLWLIAAAALGFSGMAWLALAMEVHWGQVMHQHAEDATHARGWLRRLGATALPRCCWPSSLATGPPLPRLC